MHPRWLFSTLAPALLVLTGCGTLPPSPIGTETFQKQEQALHLDLYWNCQAAEAGNLLISGVAQVRDTAQPILGLRFAATAYDKDGKRLTTAIGFPDGIRIGYEGWTRFQVLVPRGQAAARVDLGYEYHLPPDSSDRPITLHRPFLFRLAATEEYFATVQNACPL